VCIHVATFETLFPFALQEGEQRGLPRSCGAFRCSHGLRSQRLPFIGRLCEKCARLLQAGRSRFGARSGGGRRLLRKGNGCGRVMRRRKKRRSQQARDAPAREMGASLSLLLAASLSASLSASSPSPRRGRFSKFALYLKHGMSKHRPQPTDKPTLEYYSRASATRHALQRSNGRLPLIIVIFFSRALHHRRFLACARQGVERVRSGRPGLEDVGRQGHAGARLIFNVAFGKNDDSIENLAGRWAGVGRAARRAHLVA
jgi:hypothetical protein